MHLFRMLQSGLNMRQNMLLADVRDRICRKISWSQPLPPADTALFLRDFYTAQRAFLEREQLFGRPRADKFAAAAKRD